MAWSLSAQGDGGENVAQFRDAIAGVFDKFKSEVNHVWLSIEGHDDYEYPTPETTTTETAAPTTEVTNVAEEPANKDVEDRGDTPEPTPAENQATSSDVVAAPVEEAKTADVLAPANADVEDRGDTAPTTEASPEASTETTTPPASTDPLEAAKAELSKQVSGLVGDLKDGLAKLDIHI